ncbi:MAG: DNA-primase RepB domain-containing protein, partial [Janthinobacterium lividum]
MDRTEATLRKLLAALPAPGYDLGILSERGMYRVEAVSHARTLRMLPYLKYRNVNGSHIYVRPTGESPYTLLDDLSAITLARLTAEGYAPAAVVETSPGNYRHGFATHSRFRERLAPLPQRRWPSSSTRTPAPP